MTATVAQLWRYPIKAIGAEPLERIEVEPGRPFPLDRAWAVLERGGEAGNGWRNCRNFLRGAKGPGLMAVMASVNEDGKSLVLTHPERPDLAIDLAAQGAAHTLLDWISPIYPENREPAVELVTSPDEGMADVPFASVSIMNLSSLRAVSQKAGRDMDVRRFRGNLWLDGLALWEEFDLIGKTLKIGSAELEVLEPIVRCRATEADPVSGKRDINTLRVLEEGWGHTEFGVNARVITGGHIAVGDTVRTP